MNEDYLWDRTGSDAGIETLENALHVFSYKPMPPELPAKVLTLTEKPRRSFFKLGFAMAFASAIVVVLSAAWFLIPNRNIAVDTDSVKVIVPQDDVVVRPVDTPPTSINISPEQEAPHAIREIHTRIRPAPHLPQTTVVKIKNKQPPVKLTDEEKYAYGQLMLALSITGSKLKIVRDTIAGTENTKPFIEKGRDLYQK